MFDCYVGAHCLGLCLTVTIVGTVLSFSVYCSIIKCFAFSGVSEVGR